MTPTRLRTPLIICICLALQGVAALPGGWKSTTTSKTPQSKTSSTSTSSSSQAYQTFTIDNNFETEQDKTPVVSTTEIDVYNLLYWTLGLLDLSGSAADTPGVEPHTPDQVAAFSEQTIVMNGPPMITVDYETSVIAFFDLLQMYFGCVVASQEELLSEPTNCNVTATGYDVNGNEKASQTFQFIADNALTSPQQMNLAIFSDSFKSLYNVVFTSTNLLATAVLIDDPITVVYQQANKIPLGG